MLDRNYLSSAMKYSRILSACFIVLLFVISSMIDRGVFGQVDVFIGAFFLLLFRLSIFATCQFSCIDIIATGLIGRGPYEDDEDAAGFLDFLRYLRSSRLPPIERKKQPIRFWLFVFTTSFLGLQMLLGLGPGMYSYLKRPDIVEKADSIVLSILPSSWFPFYELSIKHKTKKEIYYKN